jgi:hypothetical protein
MIGSVMRFSLGSASPRRKHSTRGTRNAERGTVSLVMALFLAAPEAAAQRAHDQARLSIGIGLLYSLPHGTLWQVGVQPVATPIGTADSIALGRDLSSSFGVSFTGVYTPGRYLGLTGDAIIARIGTDDHCRVLNAAPDQFTSDLCGSLNNAESHATTASFVVGGLVRPGNRGSVQPYGRVGVGLTIIEQSLVRTSGLARRGATTAEVPVYTDEHNTAVSPYLGIGVGFAAPIASGWQTRWELRENYMRLTGVKGPTAYQGLQPARRASGHHFLSFAVGLEVVLERKRGRRY